MELKKLIIINYSCCQSVELEFASNEPTVLIGINDSGKSTALNAIGLLLSPNPSYNYRQIASAKTDTSNTPLEQTIVEDIFRRNNLPILEIKESGALVIGKIKITDEEIVGFNQDEISPQALWLIEKYQDNCFWFARSFGENSKLQEYLLMLDSNDPKIQNLWAAKDKELKQLRKDLAVTDDDVNNENEQGRFKKTEQFRAIYSKGNMALRWASTKYKEVQSVLPSFQLLGWNTSLTELTTFASGIMKAKIDTHLIALKDQARTLESSAEIDINKDLEELRKTLQPDLPSVTGIKSKLYFDVTSKVSDIFISKTNSDGDVHLETQGEGIKRQIWFALVKWAAFRNITSEITGKRFLWAFDEPETHLFPAAQRAFFEAIKKLSGTSVQCVISTHSTVFIDRTKMKHIKSFNLKDGYTIVSNCSTIDDVFDALQMRNSDFLFFDKFFLVEGDTERSLLPDLFRKKTGKSLEEFGIQFVILGGKDKRKLNFDNLKKLLAEFRKPEDKVITLLDNDSSLGPVNERLFGDGIYHVGRQDLEDAISPTIWRALLSKVIPTDCVPTEEEIESLIEAIPNNVVIQKSNKFHARLKAFVCTKANENATLREQLLNSFPEKGEELGELLLEELKTKPECWPKPIVDCFEKLIG